jgi:uncharacterized membrane protein HdeD (DUF308 family)
MTATPPPVAEDEPMPAAPATQAGMARATAFTEDLIERGSPWSSRTSWTIVAAEGVAAVILGLLFLFEPLGGSGVTLLSMGLILLLGALITTFQLWRGTVRPDLLTLAAFRSGSGVTVGLVTVVATVFASATDAVTAAMAVVVGIGFLVFGAAGIAGSFIRRRADAALPLLALVINGLLALAGLVLLFAGAAGSSSVDSIFKLLGIVLIVAGLGLGGYAYLLRQQVANGVRG